MEYGMPGVAAKSRTINAIVLKMAVRCWVEMALPSFGLRCSVSVSI
jgi:hypothetical protein